MPADLTERLLRGLYSALLVALAPVTVYHLIWRGFRQPAYLQRWNERYGMYGAPPRDTPLWVHAVSVGEVNAAAPLINALLARHPGQRMLVTTITPTGSERVRALWGTRVEHVYLPYDLSGAVRRFLAQFRPRIGLIVETELWPNLLFCCRDTGVPTVIVNARLSARSLRGYRVLRPLVGRALRTVAKVATQSADDGRRFVRLGALRERVYDTGNLKYDIAIDQAKVDALVADFAAHAGDRPVWIAASTHPGEEASVVELHRRLRLRWPELLLVWAPRHPERFRGAAQLAVDAGWRVATRAMTSWPDAGDAVFVLDTLGELGAFFACADVAFVGGSLQDIGGHNLLEPAAVGVPVVTGPHLQNFIDIARQLGRVDALRIGADADAVHGHLVDLLDDAHARAAMARAGRALVADGRGALERTLALIADELPAADTKTART